MKKFSFCSMIRDAANDRNIKLFYDIDGGFTGSVSNPVLVDIENTSKNLAFIVKQAVSVGMENTYFDFVLYDYETKKTYPCGGCYFKNYKPNYITAEVAAAVSVLSDIGNSLTYDIWRYYHK